MGSLSFVLYLSVRFTSLVYHVVCLFGFRSVINAERYLIRFWVSDTRPEAKEAKGRNRYWIWLAFTTGRHSLKHRLVIDSLHTTHIRRTTSDLISGTPNLGEGVLSLVTLVLLFLGWACMGVANRQYPKMAGYRMNPCSSIGQHATPHHYRLRRMLGTLLGKRPRHIIG